MFRKLTRRNPRQPDLGQFLASLYFAHPCELQPHLFPKGVDNARIDVALSPEFTGLATVLARHSLLHDILNNPMLQLPSLRADEQLMQHGYKAERDFLTSEVLDASVPGG